MNKEVLEKKLHEINEILRIEYCSENNIGVLSGLSGLSMFHFYYSKYSGIDENSIIGMNILERCVEKINDGYNYPTFCSGIAGMGWVLDHLEQEGFIDINNDALLSEFDDYLHEVMISDMKATLYDFLHGPIGYAFYFLKRYENTKSNQLKYKYRMIIIDFISRLKDLAEVTQNNNSKWSSILDIKSNEKGYNLSLSHGMSSIVGILSRLCKHGDFKSQCEILLKQTIGYILSFKSTSFDSLSLFPSWISEEQSISYNSRIAWCYGDLGIGLQLWHSAKILEDDKLREVAVSIMKHAAKRKIPLSHMVKDAGICHGSYGNAQIFRKMYSETHDLIFKDAFEFWFQDGINRAIYEDGFVGYKQWKGLEKKWVKDRALLEGIAGIGLSIIDYLTGFDANWDECLMIS